MLASLPLRLEFAFWQLALLWCSLVFSKDANQFPHLINATVEDLAAGLQQGNFTSVDLVKTYIARIREVNDTLHAVTELNPDALAIAARLDDQRRNGKVLGPLHGLPILIKNNIATLDQMNNTAGSYALLGAKVPKDSFVAAKLRKAGAVILGKANLSQWANFRSFNTSNGWSAYGGQTVGAYYPKQDPSGSSSGSSVAASIGLAVAALGTETSGSILSPSSQNNLVGIKPTVGLTSRSLVVPISERQDTVGPIARTVRDAAYLLQAIVGKDPDDNYTSAIPFSDAPDYVAACNKKSLQGKRFGIPRNIITPRPIDGPVLTAFEKAIQTIKAAGATVVDNTNITAQAVQVLGYGNGSELVLDADFLSDLPRLYLSRLVSNPRRIKDVASLQDFTQHFPLEDYPERDTKIWAEALGLGFNNTSPKFWSIYQQNVRAAGPDGILGALQNHSLDALLLPTTFSPGVPAVIGTPVVTVPMGSYPSNTSILLNSFGNLVDTGPNVPFGLSFLGPAWSEAALIGYAYAYEQRTQIRQQIQPYIVPKTELGQIVKGG